MSWVKLDDRFPQHPKILQISCEAFRLYITALCYSSSYQTDGKLLAGCLRPLAETFHDALQNTGPDDWISELLQVGLWEQIENGYQIHDYLEYNLSKENRETLSETRRESGTKGGLAKAKQVASMLLEQKRSKRLANVWQKSRRSQTQTQTHTPSEKKEEKEDLLLLHSPVSEGRTDWPSPAMLVKLYNALVPGHIPRVTTLNPHREKRATTLLKIYPEQSWWEEVFIEYPQSRFLMGKSKSNGHGNFLPHFDWIMGKDEKGQDNCVKVHDGNYRDPVEAKPAGRVYPPLPDGPPPCSPEVAQANLKKISGLFDKMMAEKEAKVGQDVSKYPKL